MKLLSYRNRGRLWRVYGRSVLKYGSVRKLVNAVRTELAYRRRDLRVASWPYVLFLEPLYYCNLDCPLCDRQVFPGARKKDAGRLTLELYDRILGEVGDYLYQCQIFGQGEPTLDWKLTRAIVERSNKRGIFTLVSTNCTLITPAMAEEMVLCGLDHIVCAIDGMSQGSYERYRVGGQLEDAMRGMKLLVEARKKYRAPVEIEWQFLVHQYNAAEVPAAEKLAAELGVFLRTAPLRGMEWDGELEDYWLGNTSRQNGELRIASRVAPGSTMSPWPCYFLWRSLVLNSNGKAARCLVYQNVAQYVDLHGASVREAYNHESVVAARALFAKKKSDLVEQAPSPCRDCGYFQREHGPVNRPSRTPLPLLQETGSVGCGKPELASAGG